MLKSGIGRRGLAIGLLLTAFVALAFAAPGAALADAGDHTRDEAVAYLNSLVGEECCWNDSTTDCVDVAQYYYDWLGVGARSGNGCAYHTGNLPGGWERVYSDPEPGDVAAWGADWGSSGYGHVACVVDVDGGTITVVEQSTTKRKRAGHNVACYYATYSVSSPYSYLRPNFREPVNHNPVGHIDHISAVAGTVFVKGWAYDPDDPGASIGIHVWNGDVAAMAGFDADLPRQDVNSELGITGNHGFEVAIKTSLSGSQPVDVYGINIGEGSNALLTGGHHVVDIPADTTPPVISDIQVVDISTVGYTVSCIVTDNVGVRRVTFPTWTVSGGQDDILDGREGDDGYLGVRDGDRWTFHVRVSDHNGEAGGYDTHVYAYDQAGNWCSVAVPTVEVPSDQPLEPTKDGWANLGGGKKGYVKNGKLVTGWIDIDGSKYYFLPDGSMAVGWTDVVADGKTYHYYFNPASGNLVRNTWFQIDGKTYYFRPSGNLATGWATISDNGVDKKYYLDGDGRLVTGWRDIDNGQGQVNRYYFRPSGSMATGWATIDGQKYWFRPSGNMATGFTTVDDAYKRYFDGEGHMLVGWQVIDGKTFYFRASGAMQTGEATIDGKTYTFTANGTLTSGVVPAQSDDDEILVVGQDDSDALDDAFDGGVFDEGVVLL